MIYLNIADQTIHVNGQPWECNNFGSLYHEYWLTFCWIRKKYNSQCCWWIDRIKSRDFKYIHTLKCMLCWWRQYSYRVCDFGTLIMSCYGQTMTSYATHFISPSHLFSRHFISLTHSQCYKKKLRYNTHANLLTLYE